MCLQKIQKLRLHPSLAFPCLEPQMQDHGDSHFSPLGFLQCLLLPSRDFGSNIHTAPNFSPSKICLIPCSKCLGPEYPHCIGSEIQIQSVQRSRIR